MIKGWVRRTVVGVVIAGFVVSMAGSREAQAHLRDFPFTREWMLPYPGEREIESRTRYSGSDQSTEQELEFEYGISRHFAIEPGIVFHRASGDRFRYDAFDIEGRFNAGTFKTGVLLPALNVEFEKPRDEAGRLELKFILSRYGKNRSNLTFNLNVGRELSNDSESESEYSVGYVQPWGRSRNTRVGLEWMHDIKEGPIHAGPVLVYRVRKNINFVTGYAFALNHRPESRGEFRLIGEYEFESR